MLTLNPTAGGDVGGLGALAELRAAASRGDPAALEEAAVQFEALFVGMLLKTARQASLGDGIFDSSQTQQYLEMMDRQVALEMARHGGLGFGRLLVEQLGGRGEASASMTGDSIRSAPPARGVPGGAPLRGLRAPAEAETQRAVSTEPTRADRRRFVRELLPEAQRVAERLGVDPRLLIAQAALETGWGSSVPRHADGRSTHNLFGIKAGASWRGDRTAQWTLENAGGVVERRRAEFRAYGSVGESFSDYAALIEGLPRYAEALADGTDAERYVRAVAEAGYATDPAYADKWLDVYRSEPLQSVSAEADPTVDLAVARHAAF